MDSTFLRKKFLFSALMLMLPMLSHAQWHVGVTGGADYNILSIDKHYFEDFKYEGHWGATVGVMGQYDFNSWLGVRVDLNWAQKNYRSYRKILNQDYKYTNNYLLMPVMASFKFGGEKIHGFCNLGVYGGYWLDSRVKGHSEHSFTDREYSFSQKVEFNDERDQRWDCGLVGGIGLEYQFYKNWAAQVELRYYYSTTSIQKDYMRVSDPKYNSTTAIQAGISYEF